MLKGRDANTLTNDDPVHWRINVSPSFNELGWAFSLKWYIIVMGKLLQVYGRQVE